MWPFTNNKHSLKEDIRISAEWISAALISSGYAADFSPKSIGEIERFFIENMQEVKAIPGGLLSKDLGKRLFALGSYVGEVLQRSLGGEWITNDSDPQGEINISLKFSDDSVCWPVQRILKRFKNGEEDSLVAYVNSLGLSIPRN